MGVCKRLETAMAGRCSQQRGTVRPRDSRQEGRTSGYILTPSIRRFIRLRLGLPYLIFEIEGRARAQVYLHCTVFEPLSAETP